MKKNIFKAFTLAEIMIVLTIIGVITAILLPVAINSSPDENVMKFKKGNNTLGTVIRELVNSDQYYANGDLGIKPDGTLIDGTHEGDYKYFCETFADVVSVKDVNCFEDKISAWIDIDVADKNNLLKNKKLIDKDCTDTQEKLTKPEITTTDNINFWITSPNIPFGVTIKQAHENFGVNISTSNIRQFVDYLSPSGFIYSYKIFCMDIDGINKGEDPFGYGIRADGKIFTGARADEWRADEWINKSMQKGD